MLMSAWREWLLATGAAPATVRTRVQAAEALLAHSRREDPVLLTEADVVHWLAACRKRWTRRSYWYGAHALFTWLIDEGYRSDDPTARIPRPKPPRSIPRPVSDVVVRQMLVDPLSVRSYEYTALSVLAGLRVSEVAAVHGHDVDREAGTLFVAGKGGVQAFLPLHPRLAMLARGKPEHDYWFPGTCDGHVRGRSVSQTLHNALAAAGAPHAVPHQLRHAYGTALMRTSHDMRVTQTLMRHANSASTAGYTAVDDGALTEAIRNLPWVG